jgi:hypothetical protein
MENAISKSLNFVGNLMSGFKTYQFGVYATIHAKPLGCKDFDDLAKLVSSHYETLFNNKDKICGFYNGSSSQNLKSSSLDKGLEFLEQIRSELLQNPSCSEKPYFYTRSCLDNGVMYEDAETLLREQNKASANLLDMALALLDVDLSQAQTENTGNASQYEAVCVSSRKLENLKAKDGGADFTYQGKQYRWLGDVTASKEEQAKNPKIMCVDGRFLNIAVETHGKNRPAKDNYVQFHKGMNDVAGVNNY